MICGKCSKFSSKSYAEIKEHTRTTCESRKIWEDIMNAKRSGDDTVADRLVRKAFGIKTEMSEETKAKLKQYYEDHKEEINLARKLKNASKKRYGLK